MTTPAHTVHSVYMSSSISDDRAALKWCRDTFGVSHNVTNDVNWSFRYARVYIHGDCTVTDSCVFDFVDPRHKLLFDIRWGHLGIYDSVQSLELQLDRELYSSRHRSFQQDSK